VSALIIDLAEHRRARTLPPCRAEAGQPQPPLGKRPGDRVRCRLSGAIGQVRSWRVERLWQAEVPAHPCPTFMLGVQFPDMAMMVLADEVDPVAVGVPERCELPADVEA
jgi:hypothetical protein